MKEKVAVIGGGPGGIMAAGFAGSRGKEVIIFESNEKLGKKLFITGKGRCNITNAEPIEDFFEKIISNKEFLYSSLYSFSNYDVIDLLSSLGLRTKIERGNRVFPESDKSSDVLKALEKFLSNNNVKVLFKSPVKNITYDDGVFNIKTEKDVFQFDKVIIATGGKSYPTTGSTGDGYYFARNLGHTITKLYPSLVPLEIKNPWIKSLQGLSLRNIKINAKVGNKIIFEDFGEMIFTHYGISGPIVLSMSTSLHPFKDEQIIINIDLKPALDESKLDGRMLRDFELYNNKQIKNGLNDLLPQRLIPLIIELSEINPDKPIHQITKVERQRLLNNIKALTLDFSGFRPIAEAIVTSGGVSTKEINPSTMESKIIPGLFFAGEVIDVDGLTGGYNLQIAYSTGYLAGMNV